jgi:hypothetical protein
MFFFVGVAVEEWGGDVVWGVRKNIKMMKQLLKDSHSFQEAD